MKTYSAKISEVKSNWWIIDAQDVVLGRMASHVAKMLRGKHKPMFTPSMDCGDYVIIINADKVKLTGKKVSDKVYYRHTGYPGGIKTATPETIFRGDHPHRVVQKAIERMMPKDGPLSRAQFKKLKVYAGTEHPHSAQQPKTLDFAALNPKNKR